MEILLTQEKSFRSAWAMWMGAELEQMHPDVWEKYRDLTHDVIRRMKALCNAHRQWEWQQQQPIQSTQPTQLTQPNVSYLCPSTSLRSSSFSGAATAAELHQPQHPHIFSLQPHVSDSIFSLQTHVSHSVFSLQPHLGSTNTNSLIHQHSGLEFFKPDRHT